ncbi:MAG: AAA family ATPase [Deltaproteobacteria bacterium]
MIKFPYGMADFRQIVTQGYFYCDRTQAIPLLEQAQSQLFIRPRRFGKSLLLSMLENYYDIARKDEFNAMFGHLSIGHDPTPQHNFYFILRLDFSCVDTTGTPDDVKRSLYNHINGCILNFVRYYHDHGYELIGFDINYEDALFSLKTLAGATGSAGHPIYLLIDEYDNFANTVMMLPILDSRDRYTALVHDEGVLRTFFKMVKSSTGGVMFDRVFITGVSPVVLSDITSGYNIAEDIFFEPEFGDLCGFREQEVEKALSDIAAGCGLGEEKASEALEIMRTYYNGYNFVPNGHVVVYNPTLCLYFFKQFQKRCAYPRKMLDANLAVDDSKLEYVAGIPGGRELILSLMQKGSDITVSDIEDRFGLGEMLSDHSKDKTFIASFLYYFGILTLTGETEKLQLILKVPNLVIHSLYVERVQRMMLPDPVIRDRGRLAAEKVYQEGDIEPVCAFVQDHLFGVFKNRDYAQANELTVKTAFLALLYNDILYIMDSEPELKRRYADLTMIIRPDMRHGKIFDVLIEFKFLSLKQLSLSGEAILSMSLDESHALPLVRQAMDEGRTQVMDYGLRLADRYRNLRLKKFVVTAMGFERICFLNADVLEDMPGS